MSNLNQNQNDSPSKNNCFSSPNEQNPPQEGNHQEHEDILSATSSSKSKNSSKSFDKSFSRSKNSEKSQSRESQKNRKHSRSRSKSLSRGSSQKEKGFVMRNGCCKDCMRAFNKSGRSCLCQVPKSERKYTLSDKGCNYCGCHGCNPIDVRKNQRSDLKRQFKEDRNLAYKNQRLLDSEDEELRINDK